jgi:hypothetical protein
VRQGPREGGWLFKMPFACSTPAAVTANRDRSAASAADGRKPDDHLRRQGRCTRPRATESPFASSGGPARESTLRLMKPESEPSEDGAAYAPTRVSLRWRVPPEYP